MYIHTYTHTHPARGRPPAPCSTSRPSGQSPDAGYPVPLTKEPEEDLEPEAKPALAGIVVGVEDGVDDVKAGHPERHFERRPDLLMGHPHLLLRGPHRRHEPLPHRGWAGPAGPRGAGPGTPAGGGGGRLRPRPPSSRVFLTARPAARSRLSSWSRRRRRRLRLRRRLPGGLWVSVFPAGYRLAPPPSTASPARGATILTSPACLCRCCCCQAGRLRSRLRETAEPARRRRVIIRRLERSPFGHHARRTRRP